jgi:hypothetical protein
MLLGPLAVASLVLQCSCCVQLFRCFHCSCRSGGLRLPDLTTACCFFTFDLFSMFNSCSIESGSPPSPSVLMFNAVYIFVCVLFELVLDIPLLCWIWFLPPSLLSLRSPSTCGYTKLDISPCVWIWTPISPLMKCIRKFRMTLRCCSSASVL